jgi:hypothetical protein
MLARNVFISVHLGCSGSNLLLAIQIGVSWSVGPVGTVGQVWSMIDGLKGCKLD